MRYTKSTEANERVALKLHSHDSIIDSFKFTCLFGVFTLFCNQQVRARIYGTD